MECLEQAITLAATAHAGQTDKAGEPYILHPLRVMLAVRAEGGTASQQIAAVLHDVVEDTSVTLEEIRERFGELVAEYVDGLTHRKGESYTGFLLRACMDEAVLLIKCCDIRDNLGRVDTIADAETRERLRKKYTGALRLVEDYAVLRGS